MAVTMADSDRRSPSHGTGIGARRGRSTARIVPEWIADEMRAAGLDVSFQEYESSRGRFRNVLGRLGAGPRRQDDASRDGAIVIGAHYDAYHEHPGANDNASGLAVLLELARTLPADPGRPLILAAFSTKESPCSGELMGSEVLARQLVEDRIDISLMLSLDSVGHYNDEPDSQGYPVLGLGLIWPDRGNFIAVFADRAMRDRIGDLKRAIRSTSPLPVHSLALDLIGSDHRSFRAAGLPALLVTDTGFMRGLHTYGLSGDTPDRLDYARMAQLVVGLHGGCENRPVAQIKASSGPLQDQRAMS